MKHPKLTVTIPEPCHEGWQHMTPTEKGRFCKSCTKEVIDFTSKSDEEIIKHITNHGKSCGRFYPSQLNRKLIVDRKKRNHWLSYVASFLLPMTLFSQETSSHKKKTTKTEQLDTLNFKRLDINSALQRKAKVQAQKEMIVSGTVIDETGEPLPGAFIAVKDANRGKTTDFDGNFSIKVNVNDILIASYVGYESQEIKVVANTITYNFDLVIDEALEGEMMVIGGIYSCDSTSYPSEHIETEEMKALKKRTRNYFAFQRKKRQEKRAKRKAERAQRKAERKAKKTMKSTVSEQQTSMIIKGIITDDTKMPLPGATIQLKNTNTKVFSDFDGNFTLHAKLNDILQISYVGYTPQEMKVIDEKTPYTIELATELQYENITIGKHALKTYNSGCSTTVDGDKIIPGEKISPSFFKKVHGEKSQKPKNPKKKQ